MDDTAALPSGAPADAAAPARSAATARAARRQYRHRLPVRLMHWINVVCFVFLLTSGLGIFASHPALYWGHDSDFADPWVAIIAKKTPDGPVGITRIAGRNYDTDGVLGTTVGSAGEKKVRPIPAWATLYASQGLAQSRHWHFLAAWIFVLNGVAYLIYSIASGHLRRDLLPTRAEWRHIGRALVDHLRLRHATGEAASRYNVLQNAAYLIVLFVLVPLVVVAGLAMSPRLAAVITGWVDGLGGRQSARTLHFLAGFGLLLFVAVHVFQVVVGGLWNPLRSMITGWYTLPADKQERRA